MFLVCGVVNYSVFDYIFFVVCVLAIISIVWRKRRDVIFGCCVPPVAWYGFSDCNSLSDTLNLHLTNQINPQHQPTTTTIQTTQQIKSRRGRSRLLGACRRMWWIYRYSIPVHHHMTSLWYDETLGHYYSNKTIHQRLHHNSVEVHLFDPLVFQSIIIIPSSYFVLSKCNISDRPYLPYIHNATTHKSPKTRRSLSHHQQTRTVDQPTLPSPFYLYISLYINLYLFSASLVSACCATCRDILELHIHNTLYITFKPLLWFLIYMAALAASLNVSDLFFLSILRPSFLAQTNLSDLLSGWFHLYIVLLSEYTMQFCWICWPSLLRGFCECCYLLWLMVIRRAIRLLLLVRKYLLFCFSCCVLNVAE